MKFIHEELDYAQGDYTPLHPRRNTTSYILNAQFHYKTDSVGEFRFTYFYERQPASISNYVDIPDYTDPLNVTLGSAAFGTQQEHNVTFNYNMNFRDHSFLSFQADWEKVNNSTATRSTYDKKTGRTTSQTVNVDGAWTYRASTNYSRAVGKKKRANYSFGAYYNFYNTPVYSTATSGDPVLRNDKTNSLYVSNQMNVNCSKVSVNVSADISYSRNKSVQENVSGTKLTTAYYNGGVTWRAPIDFVFKTNVSVRHYITSTARQFDNVRAVWNASITKSFLRNKTLALHLSAPTFSTSARRTACRRPPPTARGLTFTAWAATSCSTPSTASAQSKRSKFIHSNNQQKSPTHNVSTSVSGIFEYGAFSKQTRLKLAMSEKITNLATHKGRSTVEQRIT